MKRAVLFLVTLLVFVLCATPLQAQILNPSSVVFKASVDHNAVDLGAPKLTNYEVEFYLAGATAPIQHPSIGKPTPDAAGEITVNLATVARPILLAGSYTVKVVSIGPGGAAATPGSDPFELKALPPAASAAKPVVKQ